jgi:transcriptional regulator with XRE-family HTH domain
VTPQMLSVLLTRVRTERELTQRDLAKRAKVTEAYISQLESGRRKNPSLPVLKRLAKALGVRVTALLE